MKPLSRPSFLPIGLLSVASTSASSAFDASSIAPPPPPLGLTLAEFETVFDTDVRLELVSSSTFASTLPSKEDDDDAGGGGGGGSLGSSSEGGDSYDGPDEEEELWKSATSVEWNDAVAARDGASSRLASSERSDDDESDDRDIDPKSDSPRRRPYLVCDYSPFVSGISVLRSLRTVLLASASSSSSSSDDVAFRAVYNKDDKTCFLAHLSPSHVDVLSEAGFRVQILLHESKIQSGTLESIRSLSPKTEGEDDEDGGSGGGGKEGTVGGHSIVATFCPGSVVAVGAGDGAADRPGDASSLNAVARSTGKEVLDDLRSSSRRDEGATPKPTAERDDDAAKPIPISSAIKRFLRLRDDDDDDPKKADRKTLWSNALLESRSSEVCRDLFDRHLRFSGIVGKSESSTPKLVVSFLDENDNGELLDLHPDLPSEEEAVPCLLSLVASLSLRPQICSVSFLPKPQTSNRQAQWITQSNVEQSRPFWDSGLTGKGQVVAVSDTGIDTDNCYFHDEDGDIAKNGSYDLNHRKVVQYVPHADAADEDAGHGSHVAGSVAGHRAIKGQTESTGAADGMAKDAKIAFIDIGIAGEKGLYIPGNFRKLLTTGLQANAKIHSASWGRPVSPQDKVGNSYSSTDMTIDEYTHGEDEEFLFVTAAGNDGDAFGHDSRNSVGMPATCKNGISVGATESFGEDLRSKNMLGRDYLAYFSSRGPTRDGRTKPDVVAPGFWIQSAGADVGKVGECDNTGGLHFEAGTSMATPIVSGTAALVRQYFEEGYHPTGKKNAADAFAPTAALVKAVLLNGGQPIVGSNNRPNGGGPVSRIFPYDVHQNFGRIDLIRSLPLNGKNDLKAHVVNKKVIVEDEMHTVAVSIGKCDDAPDLSVTLVWNDPPNQPNCLACVLNDLDLFVTNADGTGGRIFPNGRTNGPRDSVNNAERIRIEAKVGDEFLVSVDAHDLSTPTQTYSLVVTGCVAGVTEGATAAPTITPVPTTFSTKAPVAGIPTAGPSSGGLTNMEIAGIAAMVLLAIFGLCGCRACYKRWKYRRETAGATAREAAEESEASDYRPLPVHQSVRT